MARIRINTRSYSYQRETVPDKFTFFSKLVNQKKSIGWSKYVYVCVWDMCWRNFCNFPWWLENMKSWSKIALFSNDRHFEIWFPKKRTITFFWSKLSKLHKTDPILHAVTTFSLKQGEKRTSHGPIPHPLKEVFKRPEKREFQLSKKWYNNNKNFAICFAHFLKTIKSISA